MIINTNSSRLKETQLKSRPIEAESISLNFAVSLCSYWLDHCQQIELHSDCLNLLLKTLCDIENKRLQKILSRAQNFNFVPNHIAGVGNKIKGALSRLGVNENLKKRLAEHLAEV